MFLKLHQYNGTGKAAAQLVNVHEIRTAHYFDARNNTMGTVPAQVRLTWRDGGTQDYLLAVVDDQGALGQRVAPEEFEELLAAALRTPGILSFKNII